MKIERGMLEHQYITALKKKIKNNRILYAVARGGYLSGNTQEYYHLLRVYYDFCSDVSAVVIHHFGEKNPGKTIYYLVTGENEFATGGFCALLRWVLYGIGFAEKFGMTPVVKWGKYTHYYDPNMDNKTENVFEYYFGPVTDISYHDVAVSQNVVFPITKQVWFVNSQFKEFPESGYLPSNEEIVWLGEQYRRYMRLSTDTKIYLNQINQFLGHKRTLGIHVHGTDYKKRFRGHPIPVEPEVYLRMAEKLLQQDKYEQIFLATDDIAILKFFRDKIPSDYLIYYDDAFRGEGDVGSHDTESARPLHHYRLRLETIRDVYTLASCDGLVVGLSQVSFAVRYVGHSLNRPYSDLIVLNHGINEGGKIAIAYEPLRKN